MDTSLRWVDELDCMVVTVVGEFTKHAALSMYDAVLAHPQWRAGAHSIFDYSESDMQHLEFDTVKALSAEFIARRKRIGDGRCALIMPKSHQVALGTTFRSLTSRVTTMQSKIVPNFKHALAYVSGQDTIRP